MKILLITQWFNPEPTFKGLSFAKQLQALGYEVQVLTGFPNYPGGKVYPGYKIKLYQKEMMDGISVIRVPLFPSHDSSAIRRIANYVSFAIAASLIGPFLLQKPDVMYVYHPPATVGLPAVVLGTLFRCPIVYDVQDLWPDTLSATGMLKATWVLKLIGIWCRFIYWRASKIVVLSPGFKTKLMERGVPASKIRVIYNWTDDLTLTVSEYDDELAKKLDIADKFKVIFAGGMGKAQGLESVLMAAKKLEERSPQVQLVFIGGGVEKAYLQARAQTLRLSNVKFLERVPMSEIGKILSLADVLLIHLKKDPLFKITIPGKTQAYMLAGKPILIGVEGDASLLVEQSGAGIQCEPDNPDSIAGAIERLAKMDTTELKKMGRNGRKFYEESLSMKKGVSEFHAIFNELGGHL